VPNGDMDPNLEKRYGNLLLAYDIGGGGLLGEIKQRLLEHVTSAYASPKLRPDAALCLLSLCDQMILRPYAGYVPTFDNISGLSIPTPAVDQRRFYETVHHSLQIIFDELNKHGKPPCSSHDVLKVVEVLWPQFAVSFGWG
jgi:hypothetical protein